MREEPCYLQGDRQTFPGDRADKRDVPGVDVVAGGILGPDQGMDDGRGDLEELFSFSGYKCRVAHYGE